MKKIILTLSAVALLSTASFAQEAKNSGAYAGLGYGMTSLSVKGNGEEIFGEGSSGYKLYAGYQFNQIVGVEAAYNNFGKSDGNSNAPIASETPTNISLSANLGYAFLDGQLRPFVTLGLGQMSFTRDGYGNNAGLELAKSLMSFNGGVGITYKPKMLKGLGLRVAFESFSAVDEEISQISGGTTNTVTVKTGTTNTYLGVEYQF